MTTLSTREKSIATEDCMEAAGSRSDPTSNLTAMCRRPVILTPDLLRSSPQRAGFLR
jgi:hypothetical protein